MVFITFRRKVKSIKIAYISFLDLVLAHLCTIILWWLILWVNVIGLKDAQIASTALFCKCTWDRLWKLLAFKLVDWVKKIIFTNAGQHHPICGGGLKRAKGMRTDEFSLCVWAGTFISSTLRHRILCLGFQTQTRAHTIGPLSSQDFELRLIMPLTFLVLQFTNSKLWNFSVSITTWAT